MRTLTPPHTHTEGLPTQRVYSLSEMKAWPRERSPPYSLSINTDATPSKTTMPPSRTAEAAWLQTRWNQRLCSICKRAFELHLRLEFGFDPGFSNAALRTRREANNFNPAIDRIYGNGKRWGLLFLAPRQIPRSDFY